MLIRKIVFSAVPVLTAAAAALIAAQASPSLVARSAVDVSSSSAVAATAPYQPPREGLAAEIYPRSYTVSSGDTLSSIAASAYGNPAVWPAIYYANHPPIHWADQISAGQTITLPAMPDAVPPPPAQLAPAPPPPPAPVVSHETPAGPAAVQPAAPAGPAQTVSAPAGSSGFQACVIRAESGGNPAAVNASSGAGGLYGFLPSTWQGLGHSGLPENASVAEQNQAFAQEYAQGGTSAWSAYDGC
jgi:phage tail protein X